MQNIQLLGSSLSQQANIRSQLSLPWLLAKGVSILFSPPLLGVISIWLLALAVNDASSVLWLLIYAALNIAAPVVYLVMLMRAGDVSDFHMNDRRERIKPLRAFLLFSFLSWLIFLTSGAPPLFQVFALIGTLQSAALYLITLRWKISGHGAGVAGFSVLLWGLYGAAAAPAFLFIPLVIWARVALSRHDLAQTVAGALLGGIGMLAALPTLAAAL